jgi:hypothetical protein
MLKLKDKSALGSCDKVAKIPLLQSLQYWEQLMAFFDPDFSQLVCQLMEDSGPMEDFYP